MVKFAKPEDSYDELEKMDVNAENILQKLNLPYRVVAVSYTHLHVIAVDINNDKLELAKEVGADFVINGREVEDVPGLIKEKTNGGAHSAVVTCLLYTSEDSSRQSVLPQHKDAGDQ